MIVDEIYAQLGGAGGDNHGLSYGLTAGNDWEKLLNTPNLWGQNPAVDDYQPAADNLIGAIRDLVASAEHSIDISTLMPLPDGRFLDALRSGIQAAAAKGNRLVVRVLEGVYYPNPPFINPVPAMLKFIDDLNIGPDIPVYVGGMQAGMISWNHAKLVIVDGKRAICGGHNQWSADYTGFAPIHDISIQLSGPAVQIAQTFLNKQWSVLAAKSRGTSSLDWGWSRMVLNGRTYNNALPLINSGTPAATGSTRVLSLARMGSNLVPTSPSANASRTARIAAVKKAKSHIRLAQQMLNGGVGGPWDEELLKALCEHVAAGRDLSIIIADKGGTSPSNVPYSGESVADHAKKIGQRVGKLTGKKGPELAAFLSQHLHVAPLRFYPRHPDDPAAQSWKWRQGDRVIEPGHHAKVYIIDDEAFYVGSDNAYAITLNEEGLQEFGFLVSGKEETQRLIEQYWDKGWYYSAQFEFKDWQQISQKNSETTEVQP